MSSSLTQESINYRNICFDAVFKSEKERSENLKQLREKMADSKREDLPLSKFSELEHNKAPEMHSEAISASPARSSMEETNLPNAVMGRDPVFTSKEESKEEDEHFGVYPSEYCETHYYGKISILKPSLVFENKYWVDLANHISEKRSFEGFLSENFILVSSNISEMIFSMAFLRLPFNSANHAIISNDNKGIRIKSGSNIIIFKREILKAQANLIHTVNVFHKYYEYGAEDDEKVIPEYLTHTIYCCEVVVTNISNYNKNFQVLWQVPEGSIPLQKGNYQNVINISLESYNTCRIPFYFYFPMEGKFTQFPTNLSIVDKVVAVSPTHKFIVVNKIVEVPTNTFKDILMRGNMPAVYDYLKKSNLFNEENAFTFDLILWLLKDKTIFNHIVKILRKRRIFNEKVWKFGFYHCDELCIKEYITKSEKLSNLLGSNFE